VKSSSTSDGKPVGLRAFVLRNSDRYDDPLDMARAWWRAHRKHQLWQELAPYLRDRTRAYMRNAVREEEDEAFGNPTEPVVALTEMLSGPLEQRRLLLEGSFVGVGGRRVLWGEASAEDHDERAARQRRLAGSCLVDAQRHEEAARMIREAGVTCLNDLAGEAAA